ncbi:MAG: permease [Actinomycetota bacterium]
MTLRRTSNADEVSVTRRGTALDLPGDDAGRGNEPAGRTAFGVTVVLLLALATALRFGQPERFAWLQNFFVVFGAILLEAMPFVLIGAVASAVIEVFVPASAFERIGRLPTVLQLPCAAAAGMAFPICECGSVPVARRLLRRGLAPGAAVTFMLAAPILNPVVIASTVVAYHGRPDFWVVVLGRFTLGFIVAVAVGWVIGARRPDEVLRKGTIDPDDDDHSPDESRWSRFAGHIAGDFIFMGRFLVVGVAVAAAIQTVIPQTLVAKVAGLPVLSIVVMMALAFVLSLCSESDAFVAASFTQFGPAAQLAFLVTGPMIDIKLSALYAGTYSKGFLRAVLVTASVIILAGTLWAAVIWG